MKLALVILAAMLAGCANGYDVAQQVSYGYDLLIPPTYEDILTEEIRDEAFYCQHGDHPACTRYAVAVEQQAKMNLQVHNYKLDRILNP